MDEEDEPGGFLLEDSRLRFADEGRFVSSTAGISRAFLRLNMLAGVRLGEK